MLPKYEDALPDLSLGRPSRAKARSDYIFGAVYEHVSMTVCVVRKIDGKCMRFINNARGLSLDEGFMRERGCFLELYLRGCEFFDRDDEGGYRLRRIGVIEMELLNTQADCTEELLRLWAFADSWM